MKKITFLIFFMSLLSSTGYSQFGPEGFETWPPVDWGIFDNGIGLTNTWVQTNGSPTQPPHEGTYAAYLDREGVAGSIPAADWLVTPAFNVPANAKLHFWSRLTQGGEQGSHYFVKMLIINGPEDTQGDINNEDWVDLIPTPTGYWTENQINPINDIYFEKILDVTAPEGSQVYLAFIMEGDVPAADRWLIDDVQVVEQCPVPTALTANNITQTSANLSWANPDGITQWEIVIVEQVEAPDFDAAVAFSGPAVFNADELDEDTCYKFYIRAFCDEDNASEWSTPYNFCTVPPGATCNAPIVIPALPYSTVDNTMDYGDDYSGSPGATGCGSTNGYLDGDDVVYAYTAPATGIINISMTNTGTYAGLFVYDDCADIGVSCIAGGVGGFAATPVNIPTLPVTAGTTYYIVISTWASPQTTPYTLIIQQVNCAPPVGLPTTGQDETSADLSWTNPSSAVSWELAVQTAGSGIPAGSGTTVTDNTNYEVTQTLDGTPLVPATAYQYYVRADCGDGTFSAWAGPYAFNTTICQPSQQCNYSFVMTDQGFGWEGNTMNVLQNGIIVATIGSTFTSGTGPVTITVPLCHGIPFELYWNSGGSFSYEVGVAIVNSFGQTLFTKPIGTGSPGSSLYTGMVDCLEPACLNPEGLTVSDITTTTALLGWEDDDTVDTWEVYWAEAGGAEPTETTEGTETDTNSLPIDMLTAATNYEFYVRVICGEDSVSEWVGPFPFNTMVCEEEEQCIHTFVLTDTWGDGWNGGAYMTISQSGVEVATIGEDFTTGEGPFEVEVGLCPGIPFELFWTAGGNNPEEIGVVILTPFEEDIYTMMPGDAFPGGVLYSGLPVCEPPACPKPQDLDVTDININDVLLHWTEMGDAEEWEIAVLLAGSPVPTEPGTIVTEPSPYLWEELDSGTSYVYYIRANCGDEDGYSTWSGPFMFTTAIENDDCADAITVPVNAGIECLESVSGTVTGSTASDIMPSCAWTLENDVWFEFVATSETHIVNIDNQNGAFFYHTVYEGGNCNNPVEISCGFNAVSIVSGLTIGNTYTIQVYTDWFPNPTAITSFDVCITTPASIITDNTTYTVTELVTDVLVTSTCAGVSNITWRTGNTNGFGSENGIAYFEQGLSNFPMQKGIVLSTGNAMSAPGPNITDLGEGDFNWPGDDELFDYIQDLGIDPDLFSYNNATVLEFDFVPLTDHMTFPFIFASEEYGTYQCDFSDAFAFFLTDQDGNTVNLAVVPETTIPVSVVTIRDDAYNVFDNCPSANEEYFDEYYGVDAPGQDPMTAPINFEGNTIQMIAQSDVVVGQTYHIKLVIADRNDSSFDSAVFIGPFDIGDIDLGVDLTQVGGNALCPGTEMTLQSGLDPEDYSFEWFNGDDLLEGETGPDLVITEEGEYTIVAHYLASTCEGTDTIIVEFYDPIDDITAEPIDLTDCDADGFGTFDLSENNPVILDGNDPDDFVISYHLTEEDADNNTGFLDMAYDNVTPFLQTVFVRIYSNETECAVVKSFDLIVQDLTPEFTINEDANTCAGNSVTITVTPTNFDVNDEDITYVWTMGTDTLPDTTSSITVTEGGTYTVTVDNTGCSASDSFTLTVIPSPIADEPADVSACDSYTLPALSADNAYYTAPNGPEGTGTMLPADTVIEATQLIYVYASSALTPDCTDESSFTVTINTTPVVPELEDVTACNEYILEPLATGNYYTGAGGSGTMLNAGEAVTFTQTIYVYAATGTTPDCTDEDSFIVTIVPGPTADDPADVTACGSYTLLPLTSGNYFTGTGGTGTPLSAGDVIESTQQIYVYVTGTGTCTDENVFTVTIPTPVATTPGDQTACNTYTLPALAAGNYYTGPDGTGIMLNAGDAITSTQDIYVYVQSGTTPNCTAQDDFTVTITTTPAVDDPADVTECVSYELPALTAGSYYTGTGGTGTMLEAGTVIETNQTIYVYASNGGTCVAETSFTVTLIPLANVVITEGCDGNEYVLEATFDQDENYNQDAVTFVWTTAGGDELGTGVTQVITESGTYNVTVTPNGSDCSVTVPITVDNTSCMVQKGISPNGDGLNDSFDLTALDVSNLSIFNRYGAEVFSYGNYTDQWHGQGSNGDELPTGTYFYSIERANGESRTGWIYINREEN